MIMGKTNSKKGILFVIVNPISGTKKKDKVIEKIKQLQDEGYTITLHWTEHACHATELAKEAVAENADYVVVVGGDGTVNEVAQALVHTKIPLVIIPHGSGDGLARHLKIPLNPTKAIDVIRYGRSKKIDYGKANGHLFFCTCGVGYDAQVGLKALDAKNRGKLMYAKNMLTVFIQYKSQKYRVTTPHKSYEGEAFTITCANANQYGNNGYIAPNADISDGLLNIGIIKPISIFAAPKLDIQMLTKRINNNKNMTEIITDRVFIERKSEGVMHLDGNAIMMTKDIEVKIIPGGLNVLVP